MLHNTKEILKDIMRRDLCSDWRLDSQFAELLEALCGTKDEKAQCADLIWAYGSQDLKKAYALPLDKESGRLDRYYAFLLSDPGESAHTMEVIHWYEDKDPDKTREVAQRGIYECKDDQTGMMIWLLDDAMKRDEEARFDKLFAKAGREKPGVRFEAVRSHLKEKKQRLQQP